MPSIIGRFSIKDSNLFLIPKNEHMLHLATISYGLREFWVMAAIKGPYEGKCYIEELVHNMVNFKDDIFGNFKFISDDDLFTELHAYVKSHGLTDLKKRFEELGDQNKFDIVL